MDPCSFAAAFLLSREPITQQKLTESPMAVIHASAEPGQETEPGPAPQPEPEHPRGPITPPEPGPDFPEDQPKPEPKPEPNEVKPTLPDLTSTKHARRPDRITTPVWSSLSVPKAGPTAWQFTDRFGVTWTHPDKSYLEQFVAARNATVLVFPRVLYPGSCSNGRCAR